jgi:hypothetical protein
MLASSQRNGAYSAFRDHRAFAVGSYRLCFGGFRRRTPGPPTVLFNELDRGSPAAERLKLNPSPWFPYTKLGSFCRFALLCVQFLIVFNWSISFF